MYRFNHVVIICLVLQLFVASCNVGNASKSEGIEVEIGHISEKDSVAFNHGGSKACRVKAVINADYPEFCKDDTLTQKLQKLYVKDVLGVFQDSVAINDAFSDVSDMLMRQFGESEDEIMYGVVPNKQILEYETIMNISVTRNHDDILTFCKHETVNKDGEATVDTHHYINFDLSSMKRIEIFDLFEEDALQDISELLKNKLLKQLNVEDEESLIELGYFNLDNITINSNFYLEKNGVTWNYVTYEIACYSVGETQITLGYDVLAPYVTSESILYNR